MAVTGLGLALVLGAAVPAEAQDTVKIGSETKRAAGTVVSLTNGDTACYIALKDDRGASFQEMADFEICEKQSLVGKRVTLGYALRKVMSPDCQGDPNCKKTTTVALVTSAAMAASAPPTSAGARLAQAVTKARSSWCAADEKVIFNCSTNTHLISVCASKDASATRGSLQYRFGKPGEDQPEIVQPEAKVVPPKAAIGASFPLSGGGGAWMRFTVGQLHTTVYSAIGKFGPNGEVEDRAGLFATRQGKEVAALKCLGGKSTGEMGPFWFEEVGLTDGDQEFRLPQ